MASDSEKGSGPRLVALLKLIAESGEELGLKAIAEQAGLPQSTAHRLLHILVNAGMAERGKGQSYRAGRELYRLASLLRAQFDFISSARPFLEALWTEWQETTVLCLYTPDRHTASVADLMATPHPLRFALETGMELALPWGSLGRAILAYLRPDDIEQAIAKGGMGPLSGRSLPPKKEFHVELERIRGQGFADYFDPDFDVAGVASPIFGRGKDPLGCIGITMPSQRFRLHSHAQMTAAVRDAAQELSAIVAVQL